LALRTLRMSSTWWTWWMAEVVAPPRITAATQQQLNRLSRATQRAVMAAWLNDPEDIDRIVRLVLAGQVATVRLVDAALSLAAGVATDSSTVPLGIDPDRLIGRAGRRGVFLEEVYQRPLGMLRAKDDLMGAARYAARLASEDMQIAARGAAGAHSSADRRVVGWRRVLGPGANCGLCIAIATRRFSKGDLAPVHRGCRCTNEEIYSDDVSIPASGPLDPERLEAIYALAGSSTPKDLRSISIDADLLPSGVDADAIRALRPAIGWHPELGEVLVGTTNSSAF
jgi:hypothetical protein